MERRDFLLDLSRLAALCAVVPNVWRVTARPRLADDPFQLGVASGDPTPTGGVLWTRLAPRPLEPEGGMDGQRVVVTWEVADDDAFATIVQAGTRDGGARARRTRVHVDVDGLAPDRWYFYRFIGRRRDEPRRPAAHRRPAAGATTPLRFAVASCQHYEQGLFTAYAHMAREELDLVAHLGDYIYEYGAIAGRVRSHDGLEIRTLDDYRRRYAQYKTRSRAAGRARALPVDRDVGRPRGRQQLRGLVGENGMESEEQMRARRAAGYQAWWEHQPVRVPRATSWADLNITRTVDWGALARFWVLDTRQYRSDQACDDGNQRRAVRRVGRPGAHDARRARRSDGWPTASRRRARAGRCSRTRSWSRRTTIWRGDQQRVSMDQWSGYPAARDRLLERDRRARAEPHRGAHGRHPRELGERAARGLRAPRAPGRRRGVRRHEHHLGRRRHATPPSLSTAEARAENPHVKWQRTGAAT